jgi:putative ABC transport system permease protein
MQTLWQDLRYGVRMLLKRPGFTVVVVLTLALGIGVNTAIFSVVNVVLLKPVPYQDPQRIVQLARTQQGRRRVQIPPADFADWRRQSQSFEKLGASQFFDANLTGGEVPERVRGVQVTASVFSLLGIQPLLGRWPEEREDQSGGEPVALIGQRLWQQRFGSDPQVIGKTIRINSRNHIVIGVMSAGFRFPAPYWAGGELWVLRAQQGADWENRKTASLLVLARLKDGVSRAQAQAEMETIAARLAEAYPETNKGIGVALTEYGGTSGAASRQPLLFLLAAAGLVLLIACVNVVNLLLSRSVDRRREIAIRAALGATAWRLARQLLTETVLLFVLGGALGLLAALWSVELIAIDLRSFSIPRMEEATVDGTVAGFSLLLSLLAGLLASLFPALQHSEVKLAASLNEGAKNSGASRGWRRFQRALIVAELALALILLAGAGVLLQSFRQLSQIDPGFRVENLHHMRLQLPAKKYQTVREQSAFYQQATEQISTVPGVLSACATDVPPGVGADASQAFSLIGEATQPSTRKAALRIISPDYFRTLEAPLRQGRAFTPADSFDRPRVAVINETLAQQIFPNQNALGQRLRLIDSATKRPETEAWEIVGVVADLREEYLFKPAPPAIYVPLAQSEINSVALLVRTADATQDVIAPIRRRIMALDSEQAIYGIRTLQQLTSSELDLHRLNLVLLGVFAFVALLLALVGIYSVTAHAVKRRTQEIGLRMALGAQPAQIARMVLGEGLRVIALGVAGGMLAALWLTQFLQGLLYGVSGADLLIFTGVSMLLTSVALVACWLPARRAAKVDPMIALRCE